jgi:hypothetical protein
MSDPMRDALRAAQQPAIRFYTMAETAQIIVTFLRDVHAAPGEHHTWTLRELAAAVEEAARDA